MPFFQQHSVFALIYGVIRAFSSKSCWPTGVHFVRLGCVFIYIVRAFFIFNIFLYQFPPPELLQTNIFIFTNLILCFPHRISPDSPITCCFIINIVARRSGVIGETRALPSAVIPAKAGIHCASHWKCAADGVDSRLRGNDQCFEGIPFQMTPLPALRAAFNNFRLAGGLLIIKNLFVSRHNWAGWNLPFFAGAAHFRPGDPSVWRNLRVIRPF